TIAELYRLSHAHSPGGLIGIFGGGLLAVAALAAAGLWFKRRRESLLTRGSAYWLGELDGLRAAGL
ncbi:MAG: hypothetical protein AAB409_03155, partial [Gemmatimonadota bacterium]